MMDIFVELPGASSKEVEERLTIPLEKHLAKIPGVEHVYSTPMPGRSMATVVFYVGEDAEAATVRLYSELYSHLDLLPPGVHPPLVKPREIDDVPILAFTLWSETADHYTLRRIAAELAAALQDIPDVAETTRKGWTIRLYRRLMTTLLLHPGKRTLFLASLVILLLGAIGLLWSKIVVFKLLPHDNRAEFKVMIDLPEGTPLEHTAQVTRAIGDYLGRIPEVTNYQLCIGTASPYDFNGLVRRYFLRRGPHVADIHVNLVNKQDRTIQLHPLVKSLRPTSKPSPPLTARPSRWPKAHQARRYAKP